MSMRPLFAKPASAAFALVACAALSGCLTAHVKTAPSAAVLESRAAHVAKPAACQPGGLEAISPVQVGFPFDAAEMPEAGQKRLADAVRWLACNPGVEVTIIPSADNHGEPPHLTELATKRAQATVETLRQLGATAAVFHVTPRDGKDPLSAPHLVIQADGRGW